jgi:hypothetical protein
MRFPTLLLLLLVLTGNTPAQPMLWAHVSTEYSLPRLRPAVLSDAQFRSFANQLRKRAQLDEWTCDVSDEELRDDLKFESIPVSNSHNVLLVEAGPCARGGQGSNGAMWLVLVERQKTVIVAGPLDNFEGWLYSIQPETSNGYHDVVVGWHMSAYEQDLSYFRFNGRAYRRIGTATEDTDDNGKRTIHPSGTH